MKSKIFFLLFLLIISYVNLLLPPKKREELFSKLAEEITEENFLNFYEDDDKLYESNNIQQMVYDLDEIKELMKQYDLPNSYSIFQDGVTKIVRNQRNCGCCWSFCATSALAYRYNKLGYNLSFSAQDGVSCYTKSCEGINLVDPQLYLVKNGTVTDQCFPFSSSDGKTIPECPTKCQDGSEYKKYYAQNAYRVANRFQDNFYDLVIMIMDQLVKEGPLVTGLNLHNDVREFAKSQDNCLNNVYTYDGRSQLEGNHAVTIVGYGILKNKVYWLIQNSWGPDWCDGGLIKMEIGQFNEVSFAQPLISSGSKTPVEIKVNLPSVNYQKADCTFNVESSSIHDWNNTVIVHFEHESQTNYLEFQIGKNKLSGKEKISCFYEIMRSENVRKGKYTFKEFSTYGKDNKFNLDSFINKQFLYFGADKITSPIFSNIFVSKVGSKILFVHDYGADDDTLPPMKFLQSTGVISLDNCDHLRTSTKLPYEFGYCEMTQKDIDYLDRVSSSLVGYRCLCDEIQRTNFNIVKIDKDLYPVFNIVKFFKPEKITKINRNTKLMVTATISGNAQLYKNDGEFAIILEIEYNNKNTSTLANCNANISLTTEESNFTCVFGYMKGQTIYPVENIYLLPYTYTFRTSGPFEIFIENTIKAQNADIPNPDPDPTPSASSFLFNSLIFILALLLILL